MKSPVKAAAQDFTARFREIISDPINLLIERVPDAGTVENGCVCLHNGNRVPLNGEHAFTVAIPDEKFSDLYPIPVRGYTKPVDTVKLVIKKVHAGTSGDTCISGIQLRIPLTQKPKIQGARLTGAGLPLLCLSPPRGGRRPCRRR